MVKLWQHGTENAAEMQQKNPCFGDNLSSYAMKLEYKEC